MSGSRYGFAAALLLAAALGGCGSDEGGGVRGVNPRVTDFTRLVPSDALPAQVRTNRANNNLDVADHDGRLYLAFRTGPTHFASTETRIYVVSTDEVLPLGDHRPTWRFETEIALGSDVREPRFLAWAGRLVLYVAQLGANPVDFEPGRMLRTELLGPGVWSEPIPTFEPGFIPWRTLVRDGRPLMTGYTGGERIYDFSGEPLQIYLLTTDDGATWRGLDPARPVVLTGGGSETTIAFDERGDLTAVVRNEAGDETGFGSKICRASRADLARWECRADPRKYDSPLLLAVGGELWLVARRNVTETGHYDLGSTVPTQVLKLLTYQLDYWFHPKRCALWHVDRATLEVTHDLDLPSAGDTCFPSALPRGDGRFLLVNYTSPPGQEPDPFWLAGQLAPTSIDAMLLTFD